MERPHQTRNLADQISHRLLPTIEMVNLRIKPGGALVRGGGADDSRPQRRVEGGWTEPATGPAWRKALVANRGEVAVRLIRSLKDAGLASVAVFSEDDQHSMHCALATESVKLGSGRGAAAYLNVDEIVRTAVQTGCDVLLPGYGLLSESAALAQACELAGVVFAGPSARVLQLLGDKVASRRVASEADVPTVPGAAASSPQDVADFFETMVIKRRECDAIMLKASFGGGGKGMRVIRRLDQVEDAFARCKSEAEAFFGDGTLFVEVFVEHAKHIEVQIVADAHDQVLCFGERECSVQRQQQKLVELTPCPSLPEATRAALMAHARRLAKTVGFRGLGTMEFLVTPKAVYFMECNPRLQVEHTVTEEVWGVDLVNLQLQMAMGHRLVADGVATPRVGGFAIQVRINVETMMPDASAKPSGGTVGQLEVPRAPGVRFDSAAFVGYTIHQGFDSLFAKLIVWGADFASALRRSREALGEFFVGGVQTNASFLIAVLDHPAFVENQDLNTHFVEDHIASLLDAARGNTTPLQKLFGGSAVDDAAQPPEEVARDITDGMVVSPILGEVVEVAVAPGDTVRKGARIALLNAFKMEHEVLAPRGGMIAEVFVEPGDVSKEGFPLVEFAVGNGSREDAEEEQELSIDLDSYTRPDLDRLFERERILHDDFRKDKIEAKRHKLGRRSARANVEAIIDDGTFVEIGRLAIAHQLNKRSLQDLIENTQRDGLIAGIGSVNGDLFGTDNRARTTCAVYCYDYLVLAGTQGVRGHLKKDRLMELTIKWKLPMICLTEGGGGRPSDFTPADSSSAGLNVPAFLLMANCTENVRVGVATGFNFAGNAALLGMCDIIIAVKDANIAMGGPVMVEFAGQGKKVAPTSLGPAKEHFANGVVHMLADSEADAVEKARQCVSYFQGTVSKWSCDDQRILRTLIPQDRKRAYDVKKVIQHLADHGSMLEFCGGFGKAVVTAFIRVEGHAIGVVANQPLVLGGALDGDGCDKAANFLNLCGRFMLPVVNLCDTPGFIVGQDFEATGLVKYCSRLFLASSQLKSPFMSIVLRKGYGLGAMAMTGGAMQHNGIFTVAWPTGEFGGMGLEGAVQLSFGKQLAEIEDETLRQETFDKLVQAAYDRGHASNMANEFAIDDIIDPKESRFWIVRAVEISRHQHASKL